MKLNSTRRFKDNPTLAAMKPLFGALALSTLLGLSLALPGHAQAGDPNYPPQADPNDVSQAGGSDNITGNEDPDASAPSGPVRMARFSYIEGNVTWRGGDDGTWAPGAQNFPLRQGAQLWVGDNSRAEIQFDDGSRLRLDANTLVTLQTLYSDTQGEFTEITLNDGQLMLRLKNQFSQYQVNTSVASLKAVGPSRVRVGSGQGAQFAVSEGEATIEGATGSATLGDGGYLDVVDSQTPFRVRSTPTADNWDQWNNDRDNALDAPSSTKKYCPPNIAMVADNLDASGDWRSDPRYGHVWCPRDMPADWRPYSNGQWTWVEPFGWTWVGSESWGWAPYHYGTWVSTGYGWAWVPGPAVQYWSPATVSFYQNNGVVAWCPLAPSEVHYPRAMGIGFHGGSWSAYFSIGGTACYYPAESGGNYCVARPFSNHYVNRVTYVNNYYEGGGGHGNYGRHDDHVTNVYNTTIIHNTTVNNSTFVPSNARHSGGTQVSVSEFGGHASYRPVHGGGGSGGVFARGGGGLVTAPTGHGASAFGPPNVPVTRLSFSPTHSYAPQDRVPHEAADRPVFRAPLPGRIPSAAVSAGPKFGRPATDDRHGDGRPSNSGNGRSNNSGAFGNASSSNGHTSPTGAFGDARQHPDNNGGVSRPTGTTQENSHFGNRTGTQGTPAGTGNPRFGNGSNTGNGRPSTSPSGTPAGTAAPNTPANSTSAANGSQSGSGGQNRGGFGSQNRGGFGNRSSYGQTGITTPTPAPSRTPFGGANPAGNGSLTGGRTTPNAPATLMPSGSAVTPTEGSHHSGRSGLSGTGWGQRNNNAGGGSAPSGGTNNGGGRSTGTSSTPATSTPPAPTYRPLRDRTQQNRPDKDKKPATTPTPAPPAPTKP